MILSSFFAFFLPLFTPIGAGFQSAPLHDFHTSLAEVNYNASSKSFEVSLRVFTDDLERALSEANQIKNLRLDKSKKYNDLIEKYLQANFYLLNPKNQKEPMTFYGKELEADVTWLYFEIPLKKSLKGYQIHNGILTELFADQMNMVNVFYLKAKKTYICTRAQARYPLDISQ